MEEPQDLLKVNDVLNNHIIVEGKKLDIFSPSCLVSFPAFNLEESRNDAVEKELNKTPEEVKEGLIKIKGFKNDNNDVTNVLIKLDIQKNEQSSITEEKKLEVFSPSCLVSLPASDQEKICMKGNNFVMNVPVIHTVTVKEKEQIVQKKLDVYSPSFLLSLAPSKQEDIKHTGTEKEQRKIPEKKLDVCSPSFLVPLPASNQDSENDQVVNSVKIVKLVADGVHPKYRKKSYTEKK